MHDAEAQLASLASDRDSCAQHLTSLLAANQQQVDGNRRLQDERDRARSGTEVIVGQQTLAAADIGRRREEFHYVAGVALQCPAFEV